MLASPSEPAAPAEPTLLSVPASVPPAATTPPPVPPTAATVPPGAAEASAGASQPGARRTTRRYDHDVHLLGYSYTNDQRKSWLSCLDDINVLLEFQIRKRRKREVTCNFSPAPGFYQIAQTTYSLLHDAPGGVTDAATYVLDRVEWMRKLLKDLPSANRAGRNPRGLNRPPSLTTGTEPLMVPRFHLRQTEPKHWLEELSASRPHWMKEVHDSWLDFADYSLRTQEILERLAGEWKIIGPRFVQPLANQMWRCALVCEHMAGHAKELELLRKESLAEVQEFLAKKVSDEELAQFGNHFNLNTHLKLRKTICNGVPLIPKEII